MSASAKPGSRIVAAIAGTIAVMAIAWAGWAGYEAVLARPFKNVTFAGDVQRLPRADLEALAQAIRQAPAGSATLAAVREAARRVPWVREAAVRRQFPDAVEITFEAHEAFAHWNDGAVLSTRGEVFDAEAPETLPHLRGPEGTGATMIAQYRAIARAVAPLASPIAQLRLSPRGAWHVVLESGLTLQLGRGDVLPRLDRFVAAWPLVGARAAEPSHVDLRYPNGFAMRRAAVLTVRGASPSPGKDR